MRKALLAALGLAALGCAGASPFPHHDPVTHDPASSVQPPPALVGTPVFSDAARMNGIVYVAGGQGPHPTAILLHGFPGEERNLDLAQAIRRAGWNVLFFHYRGAWGSEGSFSFGNAIQDVGAAVALAGSADFAAAHRADPGRIALVGHSMGGFLALVVGSELAEVDCIAALSPANMGLRAALSPEAARAAAERLQRWTAPLRGTSGEALIAEIRANGERFDLVRRAAALASTPVLLVAGERDRVTPIPAHHVPLVAAFEAADATSLTTRRLNADHAYSSRRIALAREVVGWLGSTCAE